MNNCNITYWLEIELPRIIRAGQQVITPEDMFSILQSIQNSINIAIKK